MLKFNSVPSNVEVLNSFVDKLTNKYHLNEDLHGSILISLTEAVNNAIYHGNCCDDKKIVRIQEALKPNGAIALRVTDEGKGFDHTNLPDPTSEENLHCCGGRGVFLMQQLSDKIAFLNGGSTVEMRWRI